MGLFDITHLVIIIIIILLVLIILAACCRGLRRAYEDHVATEEIARRRQAFFINQAARSGRSNPNSTRAVRVTTISREGDTIAMGVYEIHVPRSNAEQNRINGFSPTNNSNINQQRSRPIILDPLPPPFSTAYQVSTPTTTSIDIDEPPPSYDHYVKLAKGQNSLQR